MTTMYKYFIAALVPAALLIGYLIFSIQGGNKPEALPLVGEEIVVTGTVTAIDQSQLMLDGPTLITLKAEDGRNKIIAVPSMGSNLCTAVDRIADTAHLAVGDEVSVRGSVDQNGTIVPCSGAEDMLTIVGQMRDAAYGYEFKYRKGPDGYTTLEDTASEHKNYMTGIVLYNTREYEELMASDVPREGPPAMRLRIYENPEKLQAPVWVMRHEREVNHALMIGNEAEVTVGGANATQFLTDGLFTTNVYVVAHGAHIYVLMGDYFDTNAAIYHDFKDMVDSFTFIPTLGSVESAAKIDPRIACEGALVFMTFASGAEADAFVVECVRGEHPAIIEQYVRGIGLEGLPFRKMYGEDASFHCYSPRHFVAGKVEYYNKYS